MSASEADKEGPAVRASSSVKRGVMLWSCVRAIFLIIAFLPLYAAEEPPYGIDHRVPCSTSRLAGSPDAALPYGVERTFTNIFLKSPIFITPEPGTDWLFIVQQGGEKERPSKILRVLDDPKTEETHPFLEVNGRLIYSVAFHPGYRTNGSLYVFSNGPTGQSERTNRISRYTVDRQTPQSCDPLSERVMIEWHSQGHDGGGIVFGHDGMLYISTGDGTSDSDGWDSGQELKDLLGSILRIDVDHPGIAPGENESAPRPYSIPKDNPFVGWTNARPEVWAYGLRNPWRLAIDNRSGQIWAGNNGQDLWETAHLIRRGENYGWSVYEGSHPFYLNRRRGPTPVVPPTIEHSHAEMRSLTGGEVYYGNQLPELNGVYVYGDYSTGEIWSARHDGSRLKSLRQLARSQLQITAFTVDQRGELLIADHGSGLYRLNLSPSQNPSPKFPLRLSETGLFTSTKDHRLHPGIVPYSVNAPGWADGAHVERFMALPQDSRIGHLTNGAVLIQTLSLDLETGQPASRRRVETRLLVQQGGQWVGYSYRWNDNQTDASLVEAKGGEKGFLIKDNRPTTAGLAASSARSDGFRRQLWRYPGRAECMTCHGRAAGFVLGLTKMQLDKVHDYGGIHDQQLRTLQHIGLFSGSPSKKPADKLVDPYDASQDLDRRARCYLQVNCAVCHVDAGGGNAKMELGITTAPERMNIFGARPQHDTFGIDNAMLVFPGDPDRSILCQRLSRRGRGQMPPLVTTQVDEQAVSLFRDWIRRMPTEQVAVRDWKMEDLLPALEKLGQGRSFEAGQAAFRKTGCVQCHRFGGEGGSVGPDLSGVGRRLLPRDLLESLLLPSKVIAEGYASVEIETKAGIVITGRIEREDDRVAVVRPLAAAEEAVTVRKKDIRRRALSNVSNMPAGILNSLEEGQILDLMAYLISEGDSRHGAFR